MGYWFINCSLGSLSVFIMTIVAVTTNSCAQLFYRLSDSPNTVRRVLHRIYKRSLGLESEKNGYILNPRLQPLGNRHLYYSEVGMYNRNSSHQYTSSS